MTRAQTPRSRACAPGSAARIAVVVLALAASALTAGESAQEPASEVVPELLPGDPRIDPSVYPNHAARWRLSKVTPEGDEINLGLWMDRHEIVERDGERMILFQSDVLRHGEQPRRDLIYKDLATYEPRTVELVNYNKRGGWAYFHYEGPRFTLVYRRESFEEVHSRHEVLERRIFDPGSGALLLRFLDPKVGTAFRYPYHFRAGEGVRWATVRVTGRESVASAAGALDALVVETSLEWRFWWIPEPPYVLRLEIPAIEGGITRWELLDYSLLPGTPETTPEEDDDG